MILKDILKRLYYKIRRIIQYISKFLKYRKKYKDLPLLVFIKELNKYYKIYKKGYGSSIHKNSIAFLDHEIKLKSNKLKLSNNPLDPVVVVLVKDELERMKLFYKHYKTLGVHQFVIIDNGSTDGTLEWLMKQSNTRVYQVLEPYSAPNKIGWTEKVLALTGYNRWYIVLDSDELLDYPGSETHSAQEMITYMHNKGHRRLCGLMVDMYSDKPLFDIDCDIENIENIYCYFDTDSFNLTNMLHDGVAHKMITGGPRYRIFDNDIPHISKQAIFYYDDSLLYRSSHIMSPIKQWDEVPCCFVFRHYKFLARDRTAYIERTKIEKEYSIIMDALNSNNRINFMYEGSAKYDNSKSFYVLPYVDFIDWQKIGLDR